MASPVPRTASERNRSVFGGSFGAVYSLCMGRERVARAVGRVLWGGDTRPFFRSMEAIADAPAGGLVVDAPCGAGVAFRGLSPSQDVRYLALDLSPRMLARAEAERARRRLRQVELSTSGPFAYFSALHV